MDPGLAIAAVAGLASFLSPCILPIVPAYMAYISGQGAAADSQLARSKRIALVMPRAVAFVVGLGCVFVLLGASASSLGRLLAVHFDTLAIFAGLLLCALGLQMLGVLRIPAFMKEWRIETARQPRNVAGAFAIGLAFGFGWTPCVGPILAGILMTAASTESAARGAALLAAYAAGMGIPFLLVALFAAELAPLLRRMRSGAAVVEKIAGAILLLTGLLIASGNMGRAATWLYETFPVFQAIG